jgi:NADPH:quinone reductase-like Zn-dependent oxidoreductase
VVALQPESVSHKVAATVPVGALTAWKAVADAEIKEGQTVVIHGAAGGVGLFAVQFALLRGAHVVGVASTSNIDFVKSLGAADVVDYSKGTVASEIHDADVVIDTVGGTVLDSSYALLKRSGVLVTVAGRISEERAKARSIRAVGSGRDSASSLPAIAKLLDDKSIFAEVGKVFPLSQARAAQELSQTGHGRGRILLKISE